MATSQLPPLISHPAHGYPEQRLFSGIWTSFSSLKTFHLTFQFSIQNWDNVFKLKQTKCQSSSQAAQSGNVPSACLSVLDFKFLFGLNVYVQV